MKIKLGKLPNTSTVKVTVSLPASLKAQLANPTGIAVDSSGNVIFADGATRIRKILPGGLIVTIAGFVFCNVHFSPIIGLYSNPKFHDF